MGMTGSSNNDRGIDTSESQIYIRNQNHPLAAGLPNNLHAVVNGQHTFTWGNPATSAVKVARTDNNNSRYTTIFGYDLDKMMQNGQSAPARRVGFFLNDETAVYLNEKGWQLFDAAVLWALTPPTSPEPTADPTPSATASQTPTPIIPTTTPTPTNTPPLSTLTPTNTITPGPTKTATPTGPPVCPYAAANIPANGAVTIQAEDYMCGGQGVAYNDYNNGGSGSCNSSYRVDEANPGVDLENSGDDGTCSISWIADGEWTRYEVNTSSTVQHYFTLRIASASSGRVRIRVTNQFGSYQTPALTLPVTGGWDTWADFIVDEPLFLDAGSTNIVEIYTERSGYNFNYFTVDTSPPATPAPEGILFVVGSTTLNNGDQAIRDRLENQGYNVIIVNDSASTPADAVGRELVIVSSTVSSSNVGVKFRDVNIPVLTWERYIFDDMDMIGSSNDYGTDGNEQEIRIRDASHPLAAGYSGYVDVVNGNQDFYWGNPRSTAAQVATTDNSSTRHTIFGYEKGSTMYNSRVAPARRVGYYFTNSTPAYLNSDGWALFDAAIEWATTPLPDVPIIPTPGVTPSPTPTATRGPTLTPSPTPVPCNVAFEGFAVANTNFVFVTGDIGTTVTIIDLTTDRTLGTNVLQDRGGYACPGFADFNSPHLSELLVEGHVLLAESSDGTTDTTIVLAQPPTTTATPTNTSYPTSTPTHTPTPLPTMTPSTPYITLIPNCAEGPNVQVTLVGYNWDNDEAIGLFWNGTAFHLIPVGHGGSFSLMRTFSEPNGNYAVRAESVASPAQVDIDEAIFRIPCQTLTATPTPSATPIQADLIIGQPQLLNTPPIVAHEPLDFSVLITNVGEVDVNQQFFVDLFLDPQNILPDHIPLNESSGYIAVGSLAGGQSKQLTIQAPVGFKNVPDPHSVYGMVDSAQQVVEDIETNNISPPLTIPDITPAVTPTLTPTPNGADEISGLVRALEGEWVAKHRAVIKLIHPTFGIIATTETDPSGLYTFNNIPPLPDPDLYAITACFEGDNGSYFGVRNSIQSPYPYANIYMLLGPCS